MSFKPSSESGESDLLKSLLEPLLDDFQYWFERSQSLLKTQTLSFLPEGEQTQLLTRVQQSLQEVATARLLWQATNGKVGIDTAVLAGWHRLVAECWRVGMRFRSENPG